MSELREILEKLTKGEYSLDDAEAKLISYCQSVPNIVQYIRLVGSWDAEIEVEIEDEDKLYQIIHTIRENFRDMIRQYEVLHQTAPIPFDRRRLRGGDKEPDSYAPKIHNLVADRQQISFRNRESH